MHLRKPLLSTEPDHRMPHRAGRAYVLTTLPALSTIVDLQAAGVVGSKPTLDRLIKEDGFPRPSLIRGTKVWARPDLVRWLASKGLVIDDGSRVPTAVAPGNAEATNAAL